VDVAVEGSVIGETTVDRVAVVEGVAAGQMWPLAYTLTDLTAAEEARITALVKKAVR
jgi:hypothetical protein